MPRPRPSRARARGRRGRAPRPSRARARRSSGTLSSSKPARRALDGRVGDAGGDEREHERLAHPPAAYASTRPTATAARGPWQAEHVAARDGDVEIAELGRDGVDHLRVARTAADERDQLAARHAARSVDGAPHVAPDHRLLGAAPQPAPDLGRERRRERLRRPAGEHAQVRQRDGRCGLAEEGARAVLVVQHERRLDARRAVPLGALGTVARRRRGVPGRCAVTSSPAPAVTTAVPSRCRSTVPPPMSITNGVVPARGVVPAPSTAACDSAQTTCAPPGVRSASTSSSPLESPRASTRERERAPPLQAAAQAGILGRLGQPAPERVEHAFVRARRAAQRGHRARRRAAARARRAPLPCRRRRAGARSCRSSRPRGRPCPPRARRAPCAGPPPRARRDGRRAPRPARGRAARPAAADPRARSRSPPARRPRARRARRSGRIAASGTSSTIGRSRSKRLPISTASSPCTITPAMRWPRSRAARSCAAASSKSSSSTIASTARGRRRRQLVEPAQAPAGRARRPDGVSLTGRTTALRARSSSSSRPSSTRPVSTGSSSASSRRCNGSPRRRSARATSSLTPAAHAVEPFAPVVAVRQHAEEVGRGARRRGARRRAPSSSCRRRRPRRALASPHAVSPRRTYARAPRARARRTASRVARLQPVGELVQLERSGAAGAQRLVELEQLLVRERHELGAAAEVVGELRIAALLREVRLLPQHLGTDADVVGRDLARARPRRA